MVDHWRRHRSTRVPRRTRLTATFGLLLACALLAALPTAAFATAPEMRGEWELVLKSGPSTFKGTTIISNEANAKGEFASNTVQFEDTITGTFSGKLEGSTASVKITTNPIGPAPASEFLSTEIGVESGVGSLSLKGKGAFTVGTQTGEGTLVATRIRTYKQIEEQAAREQRELEARENVLGEWSLVVKAGSQTSTGTVLITTEANTENKFASSSGLFDGAVAGTFSGTLEESTASVEVTAEAYGPIPATKFTSTTMTIESNGGSLSMSGSGTLTAGTTQIPGATLLATRIKTYKEVTEREAKEKTEREAKEKVEREAKEKAEREAKEKTEREAKEKVEREAKEKAEREAKEKTEREAREAAEKGKAATNNNGNGKTPALVSVQLAGNTFTVGASELLSLQITNPNPYAIAGRVTLHMAQSSRAAGKKAVSLGTVSFGIAPNGKQTVKLKLSQKGRSELAHHRGALHAVAMVTTKASGQTTTTKTFDLTLRAAKLARSAR
jgi:hypothetical protein